LCKCNGELGDPESEDDMFEGVWVLRTDPGSSTPSDSDMRGGTQVSPTFGNSWNADEQLMVNCAASKCAELAPNNQIWVAVEWSEWPSMDRYLSPRADVEFQGICKSECPSEVVAQAAAPSKTELSTAGHHIRDVTHSYFEDGWYLFPNLSAAIYGTNRANGNRLMLGGHPLKTNKLAVAASRVGYQFNVGSGWKDAEQSVGPDPDLNGRIPRLQFPGSPRFCIAIWQGDRRIRTVVVAESREHPTIVDLDAAKAIYVQVNYKMRTPNHLRGGYDLWVKPLTT